MMTDEQILNDELDEMEEETDETVWETVYTNDDMEEDEQSDPYSSEDKVRLMADVADTMKAEDIVVLDLRPLTIIADFFLICTGNSSIQIRGIADKIEEKLREEGVRKIRMEGFQEASWILLDYGDVIVHVMAAEQREYYGLEEFWKEAERLTIDFTPAEVTARTVYIRDLED